MQSFFGNSKPSSKPGVSTVTVKKVVHRPAAVAKPSPTVTLQKKPPSSSSYDRKPASSSSKSSFSRNSPAHAAVSKSKTASPAPRKRRQSPQRVLPPSDSESDSDDALAPKRRRVGLSASTPDIGGADTPVDRKLFCPQLVDARGEWGRGWAGFVECEEALRGRVTGWAGGDKESKEQRDKYQACELLCYAFLLANSPQTSLSPASRMLNRSLLSSFVILQALRRSKLRSRTVQTDAQVHLIDTNVSTRV